MTDVDSGYSWLPKKEPSNIHEQLQFSGIRDGGIHAFSQDQWSALKKTTRFRLWFTYKKVVDPNNKDKIHYIKRKSLDEFLKVHRNSLPAYISLQTAKKMIYSGKIKELASAVDRPIIAYYETPPPADEPQDPQKSQETETTSLQNTLFTFYQTLPPSENYIEDQQAKERIEQNAAGILNLLGQHPVRGVPAMLVLAHILATSKYPEIKNIAIAIDQGKYSEAVGLLYKNKNTIIGHLVAFNREQEEKRTSGTLPSARELRASSIPISPNVDALSPAAQELVAKFKESGLAQIPLGASDYVIFTRIQSLIDNGDLTQQHCSDIQKIMRLIAEENNRIDALNAGKKESKVGRVKIQFTKITPAPFDLTQ